MHSEQFFAIVINGVERFFRTDRKQADRIAKMQRGVHGSYNVWLRPHYRLVTANDDIVNL